MQEIKVSEHSSSTIKGSLLSGAKTPPARRAKYSNGERLPPSPRLGRGPGCVCKHLHLGCTCQARTDLEAAKCTCSSDFPLLVGGRDGPTEILHVPPSLLLGGWLRDGAGRAASSSNISIHFLCDLGRIPSLARFTQQCCGFKPSVSFTHRELWGLSQDNG